MEMPCYRYQEMKVEFVLARTYPKQKLLNTKQLLLHVDDGGSASEMIFKHSKLPILPVLLNFLFMSVHSFVDIYSVFRSQPIHCLSLVF